MKLYSSSMLVRGSVNTAALLLSFSLGAWVNGPKAPQTVNGPASRGNGSSYSAPAPAAPVSRPHEDTIAPASRPTARPAPVAKATSYNSRLAALIGQMSQLSLPETLAALHRLDQLGSGPEGRITRQLLVSRFAEIDPQTALSYVDTLAGDEHSAQKTNALSTWASKDPQGAAAYYEDRVLGGGIASDEDAHAAAAIAGEWASSQPMAAWTWVTSLPEDARAEAVSRVATRLAEINPTKALQAINSLTDSSERAAAMQPLASRWAESAPAKTAVWVQSLSSREEQASAANGLVASWMNSDPMAVSRWVSMLPQGSTRDAAISAMVTSQSLKNDPEAATLWAASVNDNTLRTELVTQSLRRWQIHDAVAASRWAATASR